VIRITGKEGDLRSGFSLGQETGENKKLGQDTAKSKRCKIHLKIPTA
jgi:hypothetical protein